MPCTPKKKKKNSTCLLALNVIDEIYPLCNASRMSGAASFGSNFTRNRTLKLQKLLYSGHLNRSLRQAQMMSQTMGLVSRISILLKEKIITRDKTG